MQEVGAGSPTELDMRRHFALSVELSGRVKVDWLRLENENGESPILEGLDGECASSLRIRLMDHIRAGADGAPPRTQVERQVEIAEREVAAGKHSTKLVAAVQGDSIVLSQRDDGGLVPVPGRPVGGGSENWLPFLKDLNLSPLRDSLPGALRGDMESVELSCLGDHLNIGSLPEGGLARQLSVIRERVWQAAKWRFSEVEVLSDKDMWPRTLELAPDLKRYRVPVYGKVKATIEDADVRTHIGLNYYEVGSRRQVLDLEVEGDLYVAWDGQGVLRAMELSVEVSGEVDERTETPVGVVACCWRGAFALKAKSGTADAKCE